MAKKMADKPSGKSKFARRCLRSAFVLSLRQQEQARRGVKVSAAGRPVTKAAKHVPIKQRAGHPLVPTKVKPSQWRTVEGKPIFVDMTRVAWLPDDFGQGVKMTNPISRSTPGNGGTYTVWISPEGRVFYHRKAIEAELGRKLTASDGFNGQLRLHQLSGKQTCEKKFFALLSPKERRLMKKPSDFHFCVVSARRTGTPEGLQDIANTEAHFKAAGIIPTWYVDEASLQSYKDLGLKAVVGGKLCQARNKCLRDAFRMGKICVQVSDDINRWEYHHGKRAKDRSDDAVNAAHAAATCHVISPVAAARFLHAKLRAAGGPKLAGVYPLGSCSRGFGGPAITTRNFILGDFFVAEKSPVRFDEEMKLKEDYDYTAQHIKKHGGVIRCNRMTISAKHHTVGGAQSNRDKKGLEEQRNIEILMRKWPRVFRPNWKRKNEVIMRWPTTNVDDEDTAVDAEPTGRSGRGRFRAPTAAKGGKVKAKSLVKKDKLKKR